MKEIFGSDFFTFIYSVSITLKCLLFNEVEVHNIFENRPLKARDIFIPKKYTAGQYDLVVFIMS